MLISNIHSDLLLLNNSLFGIKEYDCILQSSLQKHTQLKVINNLVLLIIHPHMLSNGYIWRRTDGDKRRISPADNPFELLMRGDWTGIEGESLPKNGCQLAPGNSCQTHGLINLMSSYPNDI